MLELVNFGLQFPTGFYSVPDSLYSDWHYSDWHIVLHVLHPAISNPSPLLLLDLLAAMSLVEQIEIKGEPLSDIQIDNMNNGFNDGLKDIILNKNNLLLMSLSNEDTLLDFTAVSF